MQDAFLILSSSSLFAPCNGTRALEVRCLIWGCQHLVVCCVWGDILDLKLTLPHTSQSWWLRPRCVWGVTVSILNRNSHYAILEWPILEWPILVAHFLVTQTSLCEVSNSHYAILEWPILVAHFSLAKTGMLFANDYACKWGYLIAHPTNHEYTHKPVMCEVTVSDLVAPNMQDAFLILSFSSLFAPCNGTRALVVSCLIWGCQHLVVCCVWGDIGGNIEPHFMQTSLLQFSMAQTSLCVRWHWHSRLTVSASEWFKKTETAQICHRHASKLEFKNILSANDYACKWGYLDYAILIAHFCTILDAHFLVTQTSLCEVTVSISRLSHHHNRSDQFSLDHFSISISVSTNMQQAEC